MNIPQITGAKQQMKVANTASSAVVAQMATVKHTEVKFGSSQPRFGSDGSGNDRGFFGLFRRFFKWITGRGHKGIDNLVNKDPVSVIEDHRRNLNKDYLEAVDGLKNNIAQRDVEVGKLEQLIKAEEKEKREATAAALAMKQLGEGHADYNEQKEYAELQVKEWKEAEAETQKQKERVEKYNVIAETAQARIKELKQQLQDTDAKLKELKGLHYQAVADEKVQNAERALDAALGKSIGLDGGIGELEERIRLRAAKAQISDSGQTREQKLKEMRAKARAEELAKQNETSDALAELLGEVAGQQTQAKTTTTSAGSGSAPSGNPVDQDVKK